MDAEKFNRLERLLERELSPEERERLRRVQDAFGISDNDALWELITAMEYQRKYYDELPGKISLAAMEIFSGLSEAAEKEVTKAQSRLAESVVEEARKMSTKHHLNTWLLWGLLTLIAVLFYGSLSMWAGYCIGSGKTQPPAMLLKVPVGIIIGALCFCCGIFSGSYAAKAYSEGNMIWRKLALVALCSLLPGGIVLSITLFS